jgi:hypothetical protein
MYVDEDGFLTMSIKKDSRWMRAGEARRKVMQAFSIDAAAAAEALRVRLLSGHILASSSSVIGPIRKRGRMKFSTGLDFIPTDVWNYAKLEESLWAVGDLQLKLIGESVETIGVVTYSDVRFLEPNVLRMIGLAVPDEQEVPAAQEQPAAASSSSQRPRGRPRGSGSLADDDAPLLKEMLDLIASGRARSPNAAAEAVAGRAAGGGSFESKVKRLRDAFMAMERKGE